MDAAQKGLCHFGLQKVHIILVHFIIKVVKAAVYRDARNGLHALLQRRYGTAQVFLLVFLAHSAHRTGCVAAWLAIFIIAPYIHPMPLAGGHRHAYIFHPLMAHIAGAESSARVYHNAAGSGFVHLRNLPGCFFFI